MKTLIAAAALGLAALTALPASAQVNARQAEQQQRINQGVRSGELTNREAVRDERQQDRIANQEARMRSRHHGHLTGHEHRVLNREQNRASRHIYRTKHNGRVY